MDVSYRTDTLADFPFQFEHSHWNSAIISIRIHNSTAVKGVKGCCEGLLFLLTDVYTWTSLTKIPPLFLWRLIVFSNHTTLSFFLSTLTPPLIGFVMMFLANLFHLITSLMPASVAIRRKITSVEVPLNICCGALTSGAWLRNCTTWR